MMKKMIGGHMMFSFNPVFRINIRVYGHGGVVYKSKSHDGEGIHRIGRS